MPEETLVPLPSNLVLVRSVRSTLLQASLGSLRDRGLVERYEANLASEHRQTILETLAPVWLPVEAAIAHYHACEQLGLSEAEQLDIGNDVGRRVQRSVLSTVVRVSRGVGVTPWLGLKSMGRLWERIMQGGGARVAKLGPKEARLQFKAVPLARFEYFRNAFSGLIAAGTGLFSSRVFVRVEHAHCSASDLQYRLSWV